MIEYRTLNVRVQELHGDSYEAVVRGPAGDGRVRFEFQFELSDLDAVAAAVSRPRSARRRIETDESALARAFGERLFDLVFQGTARDVMRASLSDARNRDEGLRLMLELEGAPKLRNVPWELLWDRPKFVSTSAYTPVVRYVDLPMRPRPLEVRPPLRILGMVSSPGDVAALDTQAERALLEEACSGLAAEDLLDIDWVEGASLRGLLERLDGGTYHIFHFIGHGDFVESAADGVLLFEGRAGRSHRVTGTELGTILSDHHALRLAVINACEGARVADDWGGIAGSLMQYGLPAVIAMQFEISDVAALSFARGFYGSVARNHPVDEALADARRGMFADGYGLEWATPVMFTSVADCRLFDVRWEQVRPSGARLALTLELEPVEEGDDERTTWRLGLENEGELELRDLQPRAEDGHPLCRPFALGSGETRTLSWVAPVDRGREAVVTVTGVDEQGRNLSETATATVEPATESLQVTPEPPPVRPEPPPPPPHPRWRRPLLIAGGFAGALLLLVIAVSVLTGDGEKAGKVLARVGVLPDSGAVTAAESGAVVSGPGRTITYVDAQHHPQHTSIAGSRSPGPRSVAVVGSRVWVDSGPTSVARVELGRESQSVTVPVEPSPSHRLAASGRYLWILAPNASLLHRRTINGSPKHVFRFVDKRGSLHRETNHLAVTDAYEYVLYKGTASSSLYSVYTINVALRDADPPAPGLAGSAIKTAADYLYLQHGNDLILGRARPNAGVRTLHMGPGAADFDADDKWIWVVYKDGKLKRFSRDTRKEVGSAIDLGAPGMKVAVDRANHAWVLVGSTGTRKLVDVVVP